MRVTTKGRYALRALTNLALAESDKPIPIKRIAGDEEISPEFLEQIFFRMKKSGIISSVRGPGVGFMLDRAPEDISFKDIFDAVGEGLDLTPCTGEEECDRAENCSVYDMWQEASELIVGYFRDLTLRRIMDMNKGPLVDSMMSGEQFSV